MTDLLRHTTSGPYRRTGHDQRHAQRRVVEKKAVLHLAMLAQALAVVGGRDHQRVPGLRVDRSQHFANGPITGGNLGLVRLSWKARAEGWRRIVGRMRVVEVHPEKERVADGRQPGDGVARHFGTTTLQAR